MVPCRLPDSAHHSTFANITPRGSGLVDMNNIRRPNIFPGSTAIFSLWRLSLALFLCKPIGF